MTEKRQQELAEWIAGAAKVGAARPIAAGAGLRQRPEVDIDAVAAVCASMGSSGRHGENPFMMPRCLGDAGPGSPERDDQAAAGHASMGESARHAGNPFMLSRSAEHVKPAFGVPLLPSLGNLSVPRGRENPFLAGAGSGDCASDDGESSMSTSLRSTGGNPFAGVKPATSSEASRSSSAATGVRAFSPLTRSPECRVGDTACAGEGGAIPSRSSQEAPGPVCCERLRHALADRLAAFAGASESKPEVMLRDADLDTWEGRLHSIASAFSSNWEACGCLTP